ncbi:glycoside hydrolase family 130 protein [Candidatus Latescibacterota bacterium]
MKKSRGRDIVHRWRGNPILTVDDLSFQCGDIRNAAAIKIDGEYILLLSIQSSEGFYCIYPARSPDGYYFIVDDKPILTPSKEEQYAVYEEYGVLDPRIVQVENTYYISYDAYGPHGDRLGLACTVDFKTVERLGLISAPDTKCGVLFPRKFNGKFARLERPWEGRSLWISYSDDLKYWGSAEVVMTPRGGFWDNSRIGAAAPPFEIDRGWLSLYYGVKQTSAGPLIRIGATILEAENPSSVIARTNVPILSPREEYERIGDVPNIVYTCGAIYESDLVKIYYGAANSCICVGVAEVQDIVNACFDSESEF